MNPESQTAPAPYPVQQPDQKNVQTVRRSLVFAGGTLALLTLLGTISEAVQSGSLVGTVVLAINSCAFALLFVIGLKLHTTADLALLKKGLLIALGMVAISAAIDITGSIANGGPRFSLLTVIWIVTAATVAYYEKRLRGYLVQTG